MKGKQLQNVIKELKSLEKIVEINNINIDKSLFNSLKEVNHRLWIIEDNIRLKERKKEFDKEFIELARSVYKENDKRSSIKKNINLKYNSEIFEEKSY